MIVSETYNEDCMALMSRYPDNHFDLAVVDPPYGIGFAGLEKHYGGGKAVTKTKIHKPFAGGDKEPPNQKYFSEILRISKNQIIWGANHFISRIPYDSSCWIVWDKQNGKNPFSDCELAYTSFKTAVRKFTYKWQGMLQGNMKNKEQRIHPTQKPIALYDWIFANYAKPNDLILDTHLGSGSSRIAAHKAGLSFVGCELDKDYFEAQEKRFKNFTAQLTIF